MRWEANNFLEISPDNKALQFLAWRLLSENYRGSISSQHNRYTWEEVHDILALLDEYAPDKSLLSIRTTDISKRSKVMPDERRYTEFCEKCKERTGKGTPDAMRKNLFPDFHRMGLITRYDRESREIDPYDDQSRKKYVSLTDRGLKFIRANAVDKHYIFSKYVNELLGGRIDVLLDLFHTPEYDINKINIHEYTFFISAIGANDTFSRTTAQAVELLHSYRNMSRISRAEVIEILKRDLIPERSVAKPQNRDFHNWHNKTQQIYHLLSQTTYFDVSGNDLILIDDINSENRLYRSASAKQKYFKNHNVKKQYGFELHHVIPLSSSECKNHFKLLDTWENLVYIDGYTHAKLTQRRTKNVIMHSNGNDLALLDHLKNKIMLKHDRNIRYDVRHQPIMLKYNQKFQSMQ